MVDSKKSFLDFIYVYKDKATHEKLWGFCYKVQSENNQPAVFLLQVPRTQTKLSTMLENLGLKYEGRPHSGLDDSRNIARIALRMLQDGCQLRVNERMHAGQLLSVPSSAPVEGAPPPHGPRSRDRE